MNQTGKKFYYNPEVDQEKVFFPGTETEGFIQGTRPNSGRGHNTKSAKVLSGSHFYYNPDLDKEIRLAQGEEVPEGYKIGTRPSTTRGQHTKNTVPYINIRTGQTGRCSKEDYFFMKERGLYCHPVSKEARQWRSEAKQGQ